MAGEQCTAAAAAGQQQEQQYSLRWNDFHASILSSFRHLRDQEDFVDVTLACDGCSFTAHKVVLSACSPYFRKLLKANPCQHPIVILRDVQQKDMESLLRFMYNGEVHIGQEQLSDFLKTAQMLQVRGLADVPTRPSNHRLVAAPEQKISPHSASLPWPTDMQGSPRGDRGTSPPPIKRSRSSEHPSRGSGGLAGSLAALSGLSGLGGLGGGYSPDRERSPSRGAGAELRDSLLGQALEGGPTIHSNSNNQKGQSDSSLQAQSTGEDSNSSDTALSERVTGTVTPKTEPADYGLMDHDHHPLLGGGGTNGAGPGGLLDQPRTPTFPGALLGLQGLPGLLPGPSGMHNNSAENFVSRRSLDMMRVRATDPRPCPKCGKIYRSAHTLRTHLEDKHTICPGYRCVLCGTVAKSRNSLHSHMSRQHRGISTKDLPVLPMPSAFDPELASRLLAKAGVKVSPAELRARASPTGPRRSDVKLDAKSAYSGAPSEAGSSICGDNDPEDLTMSQHRYGGLEMAMSPPGMNHHNATSIKVSKMNSTGALTAKSIDSIAQNLSKEPYQAPLAPPNPQGTSTGSAILDTYLQIIAENSLGMGMTSEHAAVVHAAKLAQLNAMGLDKASQQHFLEKMQQMGLSNELMMKRSMEQDIRRSESDDMMMNHNDRDREHDEGESSAGEEDEYSDDEPDGGESIKAAE